MLAAASIVFDLSIASGCQVVEVKQVVVPIPPGQVTTGADGAAEVAWRVPETGPSQGELESWGSDHNHQPRSPRTYEI